MAVKGNKNVTLDYVLDRVDPHSAYRMYCPREFVINQIFCNPLRKDSHPSFIIGYKNGKFGHFDFADESYRGDFIDFVRQRFGLSLIDALKKIATDFDLANFEITVSNEKRTNEKQYVKEKETLIQVISKPFTNEELNYWNSYYQSLDDLKKENIYSVKGLWINRKKINLPKNELVFGYSWMDHKYWKIYRPHSQDRSSKWKTNAPIDLVDGLENIKDCNKAIVTKSKKDKMVIQKIFNCVCAIQNESKQAISIHTKETLDREARKIYVNFDGDEPGVKNSLLVTEEFGWEYINVPKDYVKQKIKDFADVAKYFGINVVEEYFKIKQLL